MYRRLTLLSVTLGAALGVLAFLGYLALGKWQQGLAGQRLGEFAQVAEQIRLEVKHKLDRFIQQEQGRPYTDYLYYHVPGDQAALQQQAVTLVRSPLSGRLDHGLAYGHFQVQPDGSILTPNDDLPQRQGVNEYNFAIDNEVKLLASQVQSQVLPLVRTPFVAPRLPEAAQPSDQGPSQVAVAADTHEQAGQERQDLDRQALSQGEGKGSTRAKALPIESLRNLSQKTQVTQINRQMAYDNVTSNRMQTPQSYDSNAPTGQTESGVGQARQSVPQPGQQAQVYREAQAQGVGAGRASQMPQQPAQAQTAGTARSAQGDLAGPAQIDTATVTVRIEPLTPVVVGNGSDPCSVFDGLVYMVRHVQVGDEHVLQGFRLDPSRLRQEVEDSARGLVRDNMGFELSKTESDRAAYSAVLDFGFGNLVLNLLEIDPGWIRHKVRWLYGWYFGTIAVVVLAVGLGLASLWHGAWQQLRLARQKDDFISAVSHELRTPLTSIRMYAEMLEKGWVRSEEKQGRYYCGIRQESERLSRLIENVLDFSRIQRGRKRYRFALGDLNAAVGQVVEMMRPYASQNGFVLRTELGTLAPTTFDKDAVMQIVVNLLDNAVKFARSAPDKTICVRTRTEGGRALIEVEDHGPGVPHAERGRIFEEFYRVEAESTRQTTGTGLGLALVQRFALAHQGFVRVTEAKPQGAIFTVGLGVQMG
ncbi:MAG: HAMP domain-containing histidine kinase [Phycisphaerae bacterium]|nr:HAMP domain-containing histidine kinase [Phycisphaerae bacterium]